MSMNTGLQHLLLKHQHSFGKVVDFHPATEKLLAMDFTAFNTALTSELINDIDMFTKYVDEQISKADATYGIGGYDELRTVYDRSSLFGETATKEEPRRLHLGVDIWGKAGTPVYAFMGGMVHSVAFNDNHGDYGATMIILYQLDTKPFYVLYGHISLVDIERLHAGSYVSRGQKIAHFGVPEENGHWPPHLHIQIIEELGIKHGDYPGVCKFSEREKYLANCPNPDLVLGLNRFL